MIRCEGCYYRKPLAANDKHDEGAYACHYAIDTGKLRSCTAAQCYVYRVHYMEKRGAVFEKGTVASA